jgi:hypothetical protein
MTTLSLSPDPIADLWNEARRWLAEALRDFGGPARIARTLAPAALAAIRGRLAALEALVMKLLLIEAASCLGMPHTPRDRRAPARADRSADPGPAPCALASATQSRALACAAGAKATAQQPEHPDDAATWRVRFHSRMPKSRGRAVTAAGAAAPRCAQPAPAPRSDVDRIQAAARACARRFEALRRVLADPRRAAIALARKLRALAARGHAAARRIALAPSPSAAPNRMALAHATVHAHDAIAELVDTC